VVVEGRCPSVPSRLADCGVAGVLLEVLPSGRLWWLQLCWAGGQLSPGSSLWVVVEGRFPSVPSQLDDCGVGGGFYVVSPPSGRLCWLGCVVVEAVSPRIVPVGVGGGKISLGALSAGRLWCGDAVLSAQGQHFLVG
jgi:hypothetical protein